MRFYRKASWQDGGSEVAAAVALLALLGTRKTSGSPVKEDAGWTIGVWDDLFSTATILMACPEDCPRTFFVNILRTGSGSIRDRLIQPDALMMQRDVSGHTGRPF